MQFVLKEDYIELIRLLKVMSLVASGGEAKMVVDDGLVKVNDEVERRKRAKLRKGDVVSFEHQTIELI